VHITNLDNTDRLARKMKAGIYKKCEQQNKYLVATKNKFLFNNLMISLLITNPSKEDNILKDKYKGIHA